MNIVILFVCVIFCCHFFSSPGLELQDYHIRDGAACALAMLHMCMASPACFITILQLGLFKGLAVLYERSIHPGTQSSNVSPADACSIILHAASMEPW